MYSPGSFVETDIDRQLDLIEAHSFGCLMVQDEQGGFEIAHLPFVLDRGVGPHGRLRAHVARANRIWRLATEGRPLVAVFSGPHGYVSARWYEEPGRQVPTWNYAVVHAHGRAAGPMSDEELTALLDDLSSIHERGAAEPWSTRGLDRELHQGLLRAIVGFSISIERLEGKFKLSQNRSPADRARVYRALGERGLPDDLEMMRLMTGSDEDR
ncbi:MAG TPA: FMN-binding negative transcriptional regulator [Sorangium sp.]|uniref:FMN-binding negative transcriptional regulator n=1 Tax=Sorangium sp. So ce1153 TaxID=3133333 RepID=UPI002CEA43CA|nr:FMN-binding negative transcriptional regulator [Sorangium sp.]